MIVNTFGFDRLQEAVEDYHDLDHDVSNELFFAVLYGVVFSGGKTLSGALDRVEINSTSRIPMISALQEFDRLLTDEANFPDIYRESEDGIPRNDGDIVSLAREAWSRLSTGDNYIEDVFCLSVLVCIFLSSYQDYEIKSVDFSPLMEAYKPLKTALQAKEYEYEYEDNP